MTIFTIDPDNKIKAFASAAEARQEMLDNKRKADLGLFALCI